MPSATQRTLYNISRDEWEIAVTGDCKVLSLITEVEGFNMELEAYDANRQLIRPDHWVILEFYASAAEDHIPPERRYIRSDEGYHTIKGAGTIQLWKQHGGAMQTFEFGVTTTPSDVPRQLPDAAEVLFARNQVLLAPNELQSFSIHLNSKPYGRSVLGNVTLADTRPISDDDNTFGR